MSPRFCRAEGGGGLIFRANLGGRSLQQHVGYLQAFEADPNGPNGRAYKNHADPRSGEIKDFSLREALECEDWDVVTIQQASSLSFKPESFQPYAGILISYIHKYAPHAEILIFETWAYPDDYFSKFKEEGLDQQKMYAGLKAAYQKLSADTGLRIIPVGDAFQKVRAQTAPVSLNVAGDKHANQSGKYLGAEVFYEVIFRDNVQSVRAPRHLRPELQGAAPGRARDGCGSRNGSGKESVTARTPGQTILKSTCCLNMSTLATMTSTVAPTW